MAAAVRDCPSVCEWIHLPAQSGSTRILQLMNRGYTREDYLRTVDEIRKRLPRATITASASRTMDSRFSNAC